jgi:hypothetical protein
MEEDRAKAAATRADVVTEQEEANAANDVAAPGEAVAGATGKAVTAGARVAPRVHGRPPAQLRSRLCWSPSQKLWMIGEEQWPHPHEPALWPSFTKISVRYAGFVRRSVLPVPSRPMTSRSSILPSAADVEIVSRRVPAMPSSS